MNGQLFIEKSFDLPDAKPLGDFESEMLRLGGKPFITFINGYVFGDNNRCINPTNCYEFAGKCLFFKFKAAVYDDSKMAFGWEHGINGSLFSTWYRNSETRYNPEAKARTIEEALKIVLEEFITGIKTAPKKNLPSNPAMMYNIKSDLKLLEMDFQSLFFQQSLF